MMNLGQMLLVTAALSILGILVLTANKSVLSSSEATDDSDFGITAISLATSIGEEAVGPRRCFDGNVLLTSPLWLIPDSALNHFTPPDSLGRSAGEKFGSIATPFNDFDDYNNLFVVYKSDNPNDNAAVPSADTIITIPGLRSRYFLRATVGYVDDLDPAGPYLNTQSFTKRMDIKVWRTVVTGSPSRKDTLSYPVVMSYWP